MFTCMNAKILLSTGEQYFKEQRLLTKKEG